jgi:hypothetical protein
VGKSQSESGKIRYGCSDPQKDSLGSCAKEDRRCAEGAMGADQGGKEEGLAPFYGGRKRDSHLGRVIKFSAWWHTKNRRMGRSTTPNIPPVLVLMIMAFLPN